MIITINLIFGIKIDKSNFKKINGINNLIYWMNMKKNKLYKNWNNLIKIGNKMIKKNKSEIKYIQKFIILLKNWIQSN